jgi:hypothetical protein
MSGSTAKVIDFDSALQSQRNLIFLGKVELDFDSEHDNEVVIVHAHIKFHCQMELLE